MDKVVIGILLVVWFYLLIILDGAIQRRRYFNKTLKDQRRVYSSQPRRPRG